MFCRAPDLSQAVVFLLVDPAGTVERRLELRQELVRWEAIGSEDRCPSNWEIVPQETLSRFMLFGRAWELLERLEELTESNARHCTQGQLVEANRSIIRGLHPAVPEDRQAQDGEESRGLDSGLARGKYTAQGTIPYPCNNGLRRRCCAGIW